MSAYLKFFELERSPFEGKAQSQVVLGTRALRDAFGTIESGLGEGASRICVNGDRGLGKTSLARALPKLLKASHRVAVILDPTLSWEDCRAGIARQWGIESGGLARRALIEASTKQPLVIAIDQAERASEEFLDHLDVILSYRSEKDTPVVQSVLLARLKTNDGDSPSPVIWWLDRIQTLQLEFAPLPRDGVGTYIHKHLKRAGWKGDRLFSDEAAQAIHGYTGGVPGEISDLCERLLVEAAERGNNEIDSAFVHAICDPSVSQAEINAQVGFEVEVEAKVEVEAEEEVVDGGWTVPDEFDDADETAEESASKDCEAEEAQAEQDDKELFAAALEFFESAGGTNDSDAAVTADSVETDETADAEDMAEEQVPEAAVEIELSNAIDGDLDSGEVSEAGAEWAASGFDEEVEMDAACGAADSALDQAVEEDAAFWNEVESQEELLALHANRRAGLFRPIAMAAAAALIGGIGIAWLSGGDDPTESIAAGTSLPQSVQVVRPGQTATITTPSGEEIVLIRPGPSTGFIVPESTGNRPRDAATQKRVAPTLPALAEIPGSHATREIAPDAPNPFSADNADQHGAEKPEKLLEGSVPVPASPSAFGGT